MSASTAGRHAPSLPATLRFREIRRGWTAGPHPGDRGATRLQAAGAAEETGSTCHGAGAAATKPSACSRADAAGASASSASWSAHKPVPSPRKRARLTRRRSNVVEVLEKAGTFGAARLNPLAVRLSGRGPA
jgi:hypothetical protein